MAVFVNAFFETGLEHLFELAETIDRAFREANLDYRVLGGLATYLYVEEVQPDAGRLTKEIDIAVWRNDLPAIIAAVDSYGMEYRQDGGADMLIAKDQPSIRRAVHLVFSGEKVREDYIEAVPLLDAAPIVKHGVRILPLSDLVKMKLTSFRLKDQTHIKDLDEAGLINAEIEQSLSPALQIRLTHVRSLE